MLTNEQKNRLKVFISSPDYQIVIKVSEMLKEDIRKEYAIKDTEWETLRNAVHKEGKLEGINKLLQELFTNAKQMLDEHEKFTLQDLDKKNKFYMEVNWKPDDKSTNQCKVVKFTFPDGKTSYIKKEHLLAVLFALGHPSEQRKMIPTTLTKVRHWKSNLFLRMTKDVKRGDIVKTQVDITLPAVSEEVIGEFAKNTLRTGKLPKIDKEVAPNLSALINK